MEETALKICDKKEVLFEIMRNGDFLIKGEKAGFSSSEIADFIWSK